ncbi:NAD(P)H-dependent oxidoreductase subunit E [Candidatus Eisenbacteria bacterium]|uniref:NAD(P)H-dependent oxidoreductase subunit E n=1 Tax=Eiseniibacteriota bacterium TaxID=2212470 RepID=A0ABV6YIU8_UNCEI
MKTVFDAKGEELFQEILARFTLGNSRVLPTLHLAQAVFGAITPEVESYVADRLGLPISRVHEDVTFYHLYHPHPHGRYTLTICNNLSCLLCGSDALLAHLQKRLGIGPGETTEDGLFTLEVSECIGACHQAPAFQVNGRFHGPLNPAQVDELLDGLAKDGSGK